MKSTGEAIYFIKDLKDPFILRGSIFLGLLLLLAPAIAQRDIIHVFGEVKDMDSMKRIVGVSVTATDTLEPTFVQHATVKRNGTFSVELPLARVYRIVFEAPEHVAKHVIVDARDIPTRESKDGFGMNIVPTLCTFYAGLDYSLLQRPIGVAKYDPITTEVIWDVASIGDTPELYRIFNEQYEAAKKAAPVK